MTIKWMCFGVISLSVWKYVIGFESMLSFQRISKLDLYSILLLLLTSYTTLPSIDSKTLPKSISAHGFKEGQLYGLRSWHGNSRCCIFQTPPTTGWSLDCFYPHIRENSKVVYKKFCHASTPAPGACKTWSDPVQSVYACYKRARGFHTAYAWPSFLVNNFADFPDVRVKMI